MHVNPRFDGWDKVVFNSYENGCWGSEDKLRKMPFKIGESFELVIEVTADGYKVSSDTHKKSPKTLPHCSALMLYLLQLIVNWEEYHTFEHRIPVSRVRVLNIRGDVDIRSINFIAVRLFTPVANVFIEYIQDVQHFTIDLVCPFQGGSEQCPGYEVCATIIIAAQMHCSLNVFRSN